MNEPPTDEHDGTVPDEPERFRLWRSIESHRKALTRLIEQGHEDADFYRAVLARLNELGNSERPPGDRKLREPDESLAHKCVVLWLHERNNAEAMELANGFVSRFRGASADVVDAYSKVMVEIQEGIGNTSYRHDNIATRIVRELYQD